MEDMGKFLKDKIVEWMRSNEFLVNEVEAIEQLYFDNGVDTEVNALGAGADATNAPSLLKKEDVQAGITLAQEVRDFFQNAAVTQADYRDTINRVRFGEAGGAATPSNSLIEIGDRLLNFANDMQVQYDRTRDLTDIYFDNEFDTMIASIANQRRIPGMEGVTRDDLNSAAVMWLEFKDLVENAAVATGDYAATLAKWRFL